MNFFKFALFGCLALSAAAYADDNSSISDAVDDNGSAVKSAVTKDVSLYNFSESLLSAAESCTAYSEDFAQNNPKIQTLMTELFGNAAFVVPINILGKENDLCHFTVGYKVEGISSSEYDCKITDAQRTELVEAMKDRSLAPYTDTFTTVPQTEGDMAIETTLTASRFDVVSAKLQTTACSLDGQKSNTAAFDYKKNYRYDQLVYMLQDCPQYTTNHIGMLYSDNADGLELRSGIEAIYTDNTCYLTFINEVKQNDAVQDYSVVCAVPSDVSGQLLEPYQELILKHNAGDGDIIASSAQLDAEAHHADGVLMYQLQMLKLCRLKNN